MDYKSKPAYQFVVNELTQLQCQHLAWRLDHKTICGYVTACHIAKGKGEWATTTLLDIFVGMGGCTVKSAKMHASAVLRFDNYGTLERKPELL